MRDSRDLVHQLYDAWNRHDLAGVLKFFAEDVTYHDQALGVTFDDADALSAFIAATFDAIPDICFEVVSSVVAHGQIAAEVIMRGRQQEDLPGLEVSGHAFAVHYALFGDVINGRIVRLVDYWNRSEYTTDAASQPPRRPEFMPHA